MMAFWQQVKILQRQRWRTIAALVDEDSEIISIYYGEDVSEEEAEELTEKLEEAYPDCEVELNQGGQPIYYYVVSVE